MSGANAKLKISPYVRKQLPSSLQESKLADFFELYYKWQERTLPFGAIDYIKVDDPGLNYQIPPTVVITGKDVRNFPIPSVLTNAVPASAECVLDSAGRVKFIRMLGNGEGYRTASVTLVADPSDTLGMGATATPVINTAFGTVQERIAKLRELRDVDLTDDKLLEETFKSEFLNGLEAKDPETRRLLVKIIKKFYNAGGVERSFKFLFRAIFNSDVEIRYPYPKNVKYLEPGSIYNDKPFLRINLDRYIKTINITHAGSGYTSTPTVTVSGGSGSHALFRAIVNPITTAIDKILVITGGHGYLSTDTVTVNISAPNVGFDQATASATIRDTASDFINGIIGKTIHGEDTQASAVVSSLYTANESGIDYAQLTLTDVIDNFRSGEEIYYDHDPNYPTVGSQIPAKRASIFTITTGWQITDGGTGYSVGQVLPVLIHNGGTGLKVQVNEVDNDGTILSIQITDPGLEYDPENPPVLQFQTSPALVVYAHTSPGYPGPGNPVYVEGMNPATDAVYNALTAVAGTENILMGVTGLGYEQKRVPDNAATGTNLIDRTREYTYQIVSGVQLSNYKSILKTTIHPAGMNFLGLLRFVSDGPSNHVGIHPGSLNSTTRAGSLTLPGDIRNGFRLGIHITAEIPRDNFEYWPWYFDQLDVNENFLLHELASGGYADIVVRLTYDAWTSGVPAVGDVVVGLTSGTSGQVVDVDPTNNRIYVGLVTIGSGEYQVGETITNSPGMTTSATVTEVLVPNINIPLTYFFKYRVGLNIASVNEFDQPGAILTKILHFKPWFNDFNDTIPWVNDSLDEIPWY